MDKNSDRMYVVVREEVARKDLGHAMLAVAHAVGAAFRDWGTDPSFDAWANDSFRKCLCLANEKEFANLKALDLEKRVMTESGLGGEETAVVFKPRGEWPKELKFLKLLTMKNLWPEGWVEMRVLQDPRGCMIPQQRFDEDGKSLLEPPEFSRLDAVSDPRGGCKASVTTFVHGSAFPVPGKLCGCGKGIAPRG